MPPLDFSADNAAGAGGGGAPGGAIGGVTMNDPGPASGGGAGAPPGDMYGPAAGNYSSNGTYTPLSAGQQSYFQNLVGDGMSPNPGNYSSNGTYTPLSAGQQSYFQNMVGDGMSPNPGSYSTANGGTYTPPGGAPSGQSAGSSWNSTQNADPSGLHFSTGGAIPEEDDTNGSPEQDAIQKALSTVDGVLAYGRKLHGLGGGDNEGAVNTAGMMPTIPGNQSETPGPYVPQPKPQQLSEGYSNGRMPAIPGNQSESGRPPIQPMPGPLPPTSNPFGKRADADSDSQGAIDTDEGAAS